MDNEDLLALADQIAYQGKLLCTGLYDSYEGEADDQIIGRAETLESLIHEYFSARGLAADDVKLSG